MIKPIVSLGEKLGIWIWNQIWKNPPINETITYPTFGKRKIIFIKKCLWMGYVDMLVPWRGKRFLPGVGCYFYFPTKDFLRHHDFREDPRVPKFEIPSVTYHFFLGRSMQTYGNLRGTLMPRKTPKKAKLIVRICPLIRPHNSGRLFQRGQTWHWAGGFPHIPMIYGWSTYHPNVPPSEIRV